MSYLYLKMDNAKQLIEIKNRKNLVVKGTFSGSVKRTYKSKWKDLLPYSQKKNEQFEEKLKRAMSNTSHVTGAFGVKDISTYIGGDIKNLASQCAQLEQQASRIRDAIAGLDDVLSKMESLNDILEQSIAYLTFTDPEVREAFGVQPPKDGVYQIPNALKNIDNQVKKNLESMKGKIDRAYSLVIKASGGGPVLTQEDETENLRKLLTSIEIMIGTTRGFLGEAEILKGFLLSDRKAKEVAVLPTGKMSNIKNDPKIKNDQEVCKSLIARLNNAIKSITVSEPKADLTCGISENGDFLIFGVSIKTISKTRYDAIDDKVGYKNVAVGLGSSYHNVYQIMKSKRRALSTALGGQDPLWYSKQVLTGLDGSENWGAAKSLKDYKDPRASDHTRMWNIVSDLCATLALVDALVGTKEMMEKGGAATYFVVNQKVYFAEDILNNVAKRLSSGDANIGVYGETLIKKGEDKEGTLNRKYALDLQKEAFRPGPVALKEMQERSDDLSEKMDNAFRMKNLKVKISLGALTKDVGNIKGLKPIA